MKLKFGHKEFDITNEDVVFFNGACYQCYTKYVFEGWHSYPVVISNTRAKQLIKSNMLVETKREFAYVAANGREFWNIWYRFNVEEEV